MSVVTEFTVPSDELPLQDALAENPDVTVELERVVPTSNGPLPYVLAWTDEPRPFERVARRDPAVDALVVVDRLEDGTRYRAEWSGRLSAFGEAILESGATVVEGIGTAQQWEFAFRFLEYDDAAAFRERARERDVDVELTRLSRETDRPGERAGTYGLTDEQYETLVVAFERGYFEEPRRTSLGDVAAELNVSTAAATGRLRRALSSLLSKTVMRGRSRSE